MNIIPTAVNNSRKSQKQKDYGTFGRWTIYSREKLKSKVNRANDRQHQNKGIFPSRKRDIIGMCRLGWNGFEPNLNQPNLVVF